MSVMNQEVLEFWDDLKTAIPEKVIFVKNYWTNNNISESSCYRYVFMVDESKKIIIRSTLGGLSCLAKVCTLPVLFLVYYVPHLENSTLLWPPWPRWQKQFQNFTVICLFLINVLYFLNLSRVHSGRLRFMSYQEVRYHALPTCHPYLCLHDECHSATCHHMEVQILLPWPNPGCT